MNSRNLLNLGMLIAVLILVGVVYFSSSESEPVGTPLTSHKADEITRIDITQPGKKNLYFEKSGKHWLMHEPYSLPANQFKIDSLLKLLSTTSYAQYDLKNLELVTYGLDRPLASINLNDSITILFGNSEPLKQRRYVQVGETLHLIDDIFYYQLGANPLSFVSYALLPPDSNIRELKLPDLTLTRGEKDWQVSPENKHAVADQINQLLDEWRSAQSLRVEPVQEGQAGKAIHIGLVNADALDYQLNKRGDDVILVRKDKGVQYVITPAIAKKLLELPAPAEPEPPAENSSK